MIGRALVLSAVFGLGAAVSGLSAVAEPANISVAEAHSRALKGELVLVDIRAPKEWQASGLPASSKAITMYQGGSQFVNALKRAAGGDANKPIALICATGVRSLRLQAMLKRAGFKNTINVLGGMFGTPKDTGWLKAGLPVKKWSGSGG